MAQNLNLNCPYCQGPTEVKRLGCEHCGVEIEAHFHANEFTYLESEDLQFLRIFIDCEGKIKEMENRLGLTGPMIQTRLGEFKKKVLESKAAGIRTEAERLEDSQTLQEALDALVKGVITYEEALNRIRTGTRLKK